MNEPTHNYQSSKPPQQKIKDPVSAPPDPASTSQSKGNEAVDSIPTTNKAAGEKESLTNKTLETGAAAVQVQLCLSKPRTLADE